MTGPSCVRLSLKLLDSKKALLREIIDTNKLHYGIKDELVKGSVGGHFRHSLTHWQKLLDNGLDGVVHYDYRERGTALEKNPEVALKATEMVRAKVAKLKEKDMKLPVEVAFMLDPARPGDHIFNSTWERELWFCYDHSRHHAQMIEIILKGFGGYSFKCDPHGE